MLGVHEDTEEDALDCYSIDECGRIDFTLVDQELAEFVEPNDKRTLRCGK